MANFYVFGSNWAFRLTFRSREDSVQRFPVENMRVAVSGASATV